MVIRKRPVNRRRGSVLVESALVLTLTLSFIFGVFEYSRLLLNWQLLNNATREGCRYAITNNTSSTISTDVTNIVTTYMGGQKSSFSGFTVTVTGTHQGVSTPVNNLAAGDMVTTTVSGTYKFLNIIPLKKMTTLPISSAVIMVCEGGV